MSLCVRVCRPLSASLHTSASLRNDLSKIEEPMGTGGVSIPPKRRTGLDASLPRGTGGRASASGNVITIFGAANGFIGKPIISRLAKSGNQLILPHRCDPYFVRHMKTAGELGQILFLPWNLRDENSIRKAMRYSNIVINLVGQHNETPNFDFYDCNEHGARRIARIAREMGVQRLIHFSAMNASEDPEPHIIPGGSHVLRSKARGERAVREEFPDAVIVRPAEVYGHFDRFLNTFHNFWRRNTRQLIAFRYHPYPLYLKGEETYKMPIFVADISIGVGKIVNDPSTDGQTIEFVGPHCYKLGDIVEYSLRRAGHHEESNHIIRKLPGNNIAFGLKTNVLEWKTYLYTRKKTLWSWDFVERVEATSDVLTGCPTLQDIGVRDLHVYEWASRDVSKILGPLGWRMDDLDDYIDPPLPPHYLPIRAGQKTAPQLVVDPERHNYSTGRFTG